MAAITPTKYSRVTGGRRDTDVETFFGTSASASSDTMVAPPVATATTRPRRLVSVTVKYSAAASVTVTVTKNFIGSTGGTAYDVLLNSQAMGGGTDYVFTPTNDIFVNGGDTVTVSVPSVAAATAAITVEYEVL